jgi:photosystem II stability/assembly factor-like uncharacterized protein
LTNPICFGIFSLKINLNIFINHQKGGNKMEKKALISIKALFICLIMISETYSAWQPETTPTIDQLRAVWGSAENDVYACGNYGIILYDNGTGWVQLTDFPGTKHCYGIWGSSSDNVYIVLDKGEVYNGSANTGWTKAPALTTQRLRSVWGSGPDDVFVVGEKGTMLHDNGTAWNIMAVPANTPTLQTVWGFSSTNVYAVGGTSASDPVGATPSVIIHYDGSSWTTQWSGTDLQRLQSIWGSSSTDLYASGDYGFMLHSSDGVTWTESPHGLPLPSDIIIRDILGYSSNDIFAVGDYTTILYDNGSAWSDVSDNIDNSTGDIPPFVRFSGIWGNETGRYLYTVGDFGLILSYDRDTDEDAVMAEQDNCLAIPNGPDLGTCVMTSGIVYASNSALTEPCTDNSTCGVGEICQKEQGDINANGIGDACECYADLNSDSKIGSGDLLIMKIDYNRSDCDINPCSANINLDNKVNSGDLLIMKKQYNRRDCPVL